MQAASLGSSIGFAILEYFEPAYQLGMTATHGKPPHWRESLFHSPCGRVPARDGREVRADQATALGLVSRITRARLLFE